MVCWLLRVGLLLLSVWALATPGPAAAQSRQRPRTSAASRRVTKREAAQVACPAALGSGVKTGREFCDVLTGRDPSDGILITIPPHTGTVTLTFDLHARHTYSAEQEARDRAFAGYFATVGILTMNNDLLQRAAIQAEYRRIDDAFDRIGGGAPPSGLKAVVPVSIESVSVVLPADLDTVSLLGERVRATRLDGETVVTLPGSAVAIVSNIQVAYVPGKPKPAPKKK